jgi:hypothetical protein
MATAATALISAEVKGVEGVNDYTLKIDFILDEIKLTIPTNKTLVE